MTPSAHDVQKSLGGMKMEDKQEVAKAQTPKPKEPVIKVPNYFQNCKIVDPDNFLKYRKVYKPGETTVVPPYYIHHIDRVNEEVQKTEEKFWTFKKKIYETTEQAIQDLKHKQINISPSDYEWVIDCFEKNTINKEPIAVACCINSFRRRAPEDVQKRVED